MAQTLTATIKGTVDYSYRNAEDLSTVEDKKKITIINQSFGNGKDSGEIDEIYRARRTVSSATANDDLDLAGVLANVFGQTINFDKIKGFEIKNRSTTPTDDLDIGGAGSGGNAWGLIFNTDQDAKITVPASGHISWSAPLNGLAITAGSQDVLRVAYAGTSGDIAYDIVIFGTKT